MTAKKRRERRRGSEDHAAGGPGGGGREGAGGIRTDGGRGLVLTVWAGAVLVVVTGLYRAGRGELMLGHWLALAVVVLVAVAVHVAVVRDPEA